MSHDPSEDTHDGDEFDLASVDHVLRTTRSVRRRIDFDRPIDADVIEACIESATQAPTGINAENWRFLVITDAAKKAKIAELYRRAYETLSAARGLPLKPAQRALADRLHEMPALILVCALGRASDAPAPMQIGFYGSILPAAWSLMIALRARRIGSTWTSLLAFHEDEVAQILEIPQEISQTVMLPIGYMNGAVLKPAKRRPPREVTYWNRWGVLRETPEADPSEH